MSSRKLNDLHPGFRSLVVEFLARLVEAKIPVLVVETRRTQEEHEANVAAGKSWTEHSLHIDGLAIDICPYHTYGPASIQKVLLWDVKDADLTSKRWEEVMLIAESCGLVAGGRWKQRDYPHFQASESLKFKLLGGEEKAKAAV